MAGFNPFAPQLEGQQKAPQLQGHQAPNTPMQDKPGFMDKYGPSIASAAMGSKTAGAMGDSVTAGAKDVWSSLTGPASTDAAVSELSNTMGTALSPSAMAGGGAEGAIMAQQAAASGITAAAPAAMMGATPAGFGALAAGGAEGAIAAEVAAAAATEAAAATALTGAATAGTAGAVAGAAPLALAAGPFAPLVLGGMMLAANSGK